MDITVKAAAVGVCAALIALVIRKNNPELALALCLAAAAATLSSALGLWDGVMEVVRYARELSGLSGAVLTSVIKCVGIGVTAKLGADTCRDSGSASVASSVELAGAVAALYTALPLMRTLLSMVGRLA